MRGMAEYVDRLFGRRGQQRDRFDGDGLEWYIAAIGRGAGDTLHHIHALDHFAEYRIPPAAFGFLGVVEECIVGDIDEELPGR